MRSFVDWGGVYGLDNRWDMIIPVRSFVCIYRPPCIGLPRRLFFRSATSISMWDIPSSYYFYLALNIRFFLISYGKENTLQKKALHVALRIGPGGFF